INENLNNNFISLLVINSFVNPNTGIGSATSAGVSLLGKSASEVLSNQLSNWLSQISKNVNIGINYRPGDNISQEEVAVALSTQLFNDRVTVSSNLGVATGQTATGENKNSNQIVGDVDIEVKISKALKLKVYNHTNQ
ncbi:MAG TPA: translocation/assembly module TamB domain-containing protein, partial [Bacteroidales bacterium]|nr:translocation/assembly module TamB domain-containing protein [Bacteroidales bacterium]